MEKKYYKACLRYNKSQNGPDYFNAVIELREPYYVYKKETFFKKKIQRYKTTWQNFPIYVQEIDGKFYDVVLKKEIFPGEVKGVCFTYLTEVTEGEVLMNLKRLNASAIVTYYDKMKKLQNKSMIEYDIRHPKNVRKKCKNN